MERRQIRLVQQQMQALNVEERQWLKIQGVDRPEELARRSVWYRPDGSSGLGPSDLYHVRLYRAKGFTLKAPISVALEHQPPRVPMPSIARQVLSLLGQGARWEGSASELATIIGNRTPTGLSGLLGTPKVAAALASAEVTVYRGYKGNRRALRLERRGAPPSHYENSGTEYQRQYAQTPRADSRHAWWPTNRGA
jgi:hypothetical protein